MAEKDFVVKNGLVVNTNLIVADGDLNRVGINNSSPDAILTVTGTANVSGNVALGSNLTVSDTISTVNKVLVGSNVVVNSSLIFIGNSTVNSVQNSSIVQVVNSTSTSNLTAIDLKIGITVVNSSVIAVGANASVNSSVVKVGNTTVNSSVIFLGNTVVNLVANSTSISLSGVQSLNSTSFVGTANNANNLSGQPASYYTNATNLSTGTLPSARISGNYTGITNVGTLGVLTVTGNTSLTSLVSITSNSIANSVSISGAANVNIDNGVLFVDGTTNRVGINNTAPDAALTVTGSANVSGNLSVLGNLIITGNTVSQGTQEFTGALTPSSNGINLGNTTNRWVIFANSADFSNRISIGNSTVNVVSNSTVLTIGNGSVNVSINSTAFSGTSANATNLNNQPASFYTNAENITTGTLSALRLPTGNSSTIGGLQIVDSVTNTSITVAPTANNVKNAYDRAIDANTRAASAQSAAISAYSNAITFASNASNINTGTLVSARISGAYTGITQVGTLAGLVVTGNINMDSGVLFVDGTNNRIGVNTTAPSVSLQIASNDAVILPIGNTAQRPSGANGMLRFNTDTTTFEGYSNGAWGTIAGSSGGYYKGNDGAVGNTNSKANLFRINSNTQTNNITISAGENALTVGPIVVSPGITLTIETGGRAVII